MMAATILSDKNLHLNMSGHSSSSASTPSASSSYSTPPPLTPSFEPNMQEAYDPDVAVPDLIAQIQRLDASLDPKKSLRALDLPEMDWGQNVSALLKEGTARAHVQAEHSLGAAALVKGELGLQEYIRWLAVLWRLYDALELGLNEHAANPVLAPTYDPAVLARSDSLAKDITYLLSLLPESSTSTSSPSPHLLPEGPLPPFPLPAFLLPIFTRAPTALTLYINHLKHLASSSKLAPGLLAHSYVRYLGDLSGGQFIAAKIKRAYALDNGLDGLRFYHFDLQGASSGADDETRADGRRRAGEVKDWFRKGMDEGVGEDEDLKATLVREANLAFALNTYLFSVIRLNPTPPGSTTSSVASTQSAAGEKREQTGTQVASTNESTSSWIEKIAIFGTTVFIGWALGQYVLPLATDIVSEHTRFGHNEL